MPSQTFFNLPDEKRDQIVQIAIDEFADNDYDSASISRIVARAGIAKGSFYQYFADKEDLYAYLLGLLLEAKTRFMSLEHPDPQHVGIFAYLRWSAEAGVAFQLAYPRLTRIGLRALSASRLPTAFNVQVREATLLFYSRLVEIGIEQGDLAPDVDRELAAVILDSALTGVGKLVIEHLGREGVTAGSDEQAIFDSPAVKGLFTRAVSILENGLGRREAVEGETNGQVPQNSLA